MTGDGCPLCGANHAACGQPSTARPVDILAIKESTVANQKYRVTVNGRSTVMKLSYDDAENYPDAELLDDTATEPTAKPAAKQRRAPNKARTAQNKSAE
jgi:hypothetical protein